MSTSDDDLQGPDAPEWLAYEQIARLVRENELLSGMVPKESVYILDGTVDAAVSDSDVLPKPFVRLKVDPDAFEWITATSHAFPIRIQVEIATGGYNQRNILKLWNAVRTALSPHGPSLIPGKSNLEIMQGARIDTMKFVNAQFDAISPEEGGRGYFYGRADLRLEMRIRT